MSGRRTAKYIGSKISSVVENVPAGINRADINPDKVHPLGFTCVIKLAPNQ